MPAQRTVQRRAPEPDPLFFFTGGPGEAATQDHVRMSPAFARLNAMRDIVLVDQRGTGGSSPLKCDDPVEENETWDEALIGTVIRDCLQSIDADPRSYSTALAVDDLDEVRAALGYDTINLYGISYGTRVAQTYMREYPWACPHCHSRRHLISAAMTITIGASLTLVAILMYGRERILFGR